MENWDNWFFLALNLILSIPIAIFVNLVTPTIDTYLKNRSLSVRERKIKTLLIRYINIKNQKEYFVFKTTIPIYFKMPIIFWLPFISIGLAFLILTLLPEFSWFRATLLFIAAIPLHYSTVLIFKDFAYMQDFVFFDRFKRRTIKKLRRLDCNPTDYGIE